LHAWQTLLASRSPGTGREYNPVWMTPGSIVTRIWRRWLMYLYGRYRDRAARCPVCGEPYEWESRSATVPPMCPECLERRRWFDALPVEGTIVVVRPGHEQGNLEITMTPLRGNRWSVTVREEGSATTTDGDSKIAKASVLRLIETEEPRYEIRLLRGE